MITYSSWSYLRKSLNSSVRFLSCAVESTQPTNTCNISPTQKSLKVAIIGSPNSGKSTLINQIIGRKVFAVSQKVHTTRCRARAITVEDETQLVFLDTPGLVTVSESEKYKLDPEFVKGGEDAIYEADVIGVVHDLSNGYTRAHLDPKVLRLLHFHRDKESFLVLNKIDTLKSKRYLLDLSKVLTGGMMNTFDGSEKRGPISEKLVAEVIKRKSYWEHFSDVFMVSALLGSGTDDIRRYLLSLAKPQEWPFPPDSFTDLKPWQIIEETVRSKLLQHLPQEIPYTVEVELEYLDQSNEGRITAVVLVLCKAKRQEKLVMGSGGSRIRIIAAEAEQDLSDTFLADVHLKLVVTLKPDLKLPWDKPIA